MSYNDEDLLKFVNAQGYLLQQTAEYTVGKNGPSGQVPHWQTVSVEHRWRHEDSGKSGYIDLVIKDPNYLMGVVECKRYTEGTPWIFLCPNHVGSSLTASHLHWSFSGTGTKPKQGWDIFRHSPATPESNFCIVPNQQRDKPTLERIAGELLYSVEALGNQHNLVSAKSGGRAAVFLPIVLTTAQLYTCHYNVGDIDSGSGALELAQSAFKEIPYIRFTKVFTDSDVSYTDLEYIRDIEPKQRQTILVVQAASFAEFLNSCNKLMFRDSYHLPWN